MREDLERLNERLDKLKAAGKIRLTPDADAPCWMMVNRKAFQEVIGQLVSEINYAGFKVTCTSGSQTSLQGSGP